ncbi:MAG: hypothetical protein P8Y22_06325 [Sulfurimonas sp.]|jgi:hypothetical protein
MKIFFKVITLIISFTFLTGCTNLYTSIDALKADKSKNGTMYTYDQNFSTVETKVETFMKHCYNEEHPIISTSIQGYPTNIEGVSRLYGKKSIPNGILFYVSVGSQYYTLGAEITPNDLNDSTTLKLYSNNMMWGMVFDNIDDYIKNGQLECNKI